MINTIQTFNPATGQELAEYKSYDSAQIDASIALAYDAFRMWSATDLAARCKGVRALGGILRTQREELARLITTEMGKPYLEALAEIDKCAVTCDYYIDTAHRFLTPETVETSAELSQIVYEPLGVVYAVMPWNFPFWQLFRFAAPAILAGNAILLKHSPNVTGCALAIEKVFAEAGFPNGLLRTLVVHDAEVGDVSDRVLSDPRVAAATLTGSTRAGSAVAAGAGRALKKTVLELGGSDPFVVLADADLGAAAKAAAASRFLCSGQVCIAAKRIIVHKDVADDFQALFLDEVRTLTIGDPMLACTTLGPLARADLLDTIERQVNEAVEAGAQVLLEGGRAGHDGWFFKPTVLTGVNRDMAVYAEETFGPVAIILLAEDDDDAVRIANDTEYGLGASVWSQDRQRALDLGKRIESGALFINAVVGSDPRIPFGGIKRSGYGRELGAAGIREFTNMRTVWVAGNP